MNANPNSHPEPDLSWIPPKKNPAAETESAAPHVFTYRDVPSVWTLEAKVSWLIENLVIEGGITLITGVSGHGKSIFTTAMAGAVAHGVPFLGLQTVSRKVVYMDRENPLALVKQHLHDLHIGATSQLVYWGAWCEQPPDSPNAGSLIELAQHEKPLFIIDAAISFHTGDENSASDTRSFMDSFRRLSSAGASVVLLHNVSDKDNTRNYRGSSDYQASVDIAWKLIKTSDNDAGLLTDLQLLPFKNRYRGGTPLFLSFRDGAFHDRGRVPQPDNDKEKFIAIVRVNPGLTGAKLTGIAMAQGIPKNKVERMLVDGVAGRWLSFTKAPRGGKLYYLANMTSQLPSFPGDS